MDIEIKNARFVQPYVDVVDMTVRSLSKSFPRGSVVVRQTGPLTSIVLPRAPAHKDWVEVYVDDFRLVNASLDFGATHEDFEVFDDRIDFHNSVTGDVKVVLDYDANPIRMPDENIIVIDNCQGAKTKATRVGDLYVSYFCKPMILTEPHYGYVRLTDDGLNLVYFPNAGYAGYDAFSYTVISERGQIAAPKCVNVKVGNPVPTPKPQV